MDYILIRLTYRSNIVKILRIVNFRVSVLYLLKWAVQYDIENSRNCPRLKFKQCFKEVILLLYGLLIFNWKRILHILNVDVTTQISTTFNEEKRRKT